METEWWCREVEVKYLWFLGSLMELRRSFPSVFLVRKATKMQPVFLSRICMGVLESERVGSDNFSQMIVIIKSNCTGLGISFQTLEMSCLWWTGSSQIFFEEMPNEKVSSPHYLKTLMKLGRHGISYSLKCNPRSISKISFCANLSVSPIDTDIEL